MVDVRSVSKLENQLEAPRPHAVVKDVTGNVAAGFEAWRARCGEISTPLHSHPKPWSSEEAAPVTAAAAIRKLKKANSCTSQAHITHTQAQAHHPIPTYA